MANKTALHFAKLAGGRSVALAVGIGDRRQVTGDMYQVICEPDTWHFIYYYYYYYFIFFYLHASRKGRSMVISHNWPVNLGTKAPYAPSS